MQKQATKNRRRKTGSGPSLYWLKWPKTWTIPIALILCLATGAVGLAGYDVDLSLDIDPANLNQEVKCKAHVTDDDGNVSGGGTVYFSVDPTDGGDFSSSSSCSPNSGYCSVKYTPTKAEDQTHKIKAAFWSGGTKLASDTETLKVRRPTRIELIIDPPGISINESTKVCPHLFDEVTGDEIYNPEIWLTTDATCAEGEFNDGDCIGDHSTVQLDFFLKCEGYTPFSGDLATHTITAIFNGNDNYSHSTASAPLDVLKRLAEVTVECPTKEQAEAAHNVTVTVTDSDKNDGDPITPTGEIQDADQNTLCTLSADNDRDAVCSFQVETTIGHPEIVLVYYPGDESHYPMVPEGPMILGGDPSELGQVPVFSLIGAYEKACWSLSLASTLTSTIGGTVCAWIGAADITDIAAAVCATIVNTAVLAINTTQSGLCKDWDADGIYDVIEEQYCNNDISSSLGDTDGDTLGDCQELGWADGWLDRANSPGELSFCPSPMHWDSDGDGLGDGEELKEYETDYCNAHSDFDGLTDKEEVDTWLEGDVRLHLDPLLQDTDGDGLSDYIEYHVEHSPCPFGNEPDSDGDGLIDGYEDKNADGCWGGHDSSKSPGDEGYCTGGITVGGSNTHATKTITDWETDLCDRDTDDDGLSDGEEEGLFGINITPEDVSTVVGSPGGDISISGQTITVPALDTDMDNDELSDYDEVNTYQTDAMDADTDNDTLSDEAEVYTFNYSDARDHANPRQSDTDGDGLPDNHEIDEGSPYVNDGDSDDDGLQDGYEDSNRDGTITNTVGGSDTQGSGETDFCNPDSDGDGLTDGEEEGVIGAGSMTPTGVSTTVGAEGPSIAITVPALDTDSDNDGLSDYDEINKYQTDPMDADTDDDTLSDKDEVDSWSRADSRDHSNPLMVDTDGDGLTDNVEFTPGCICGTGKDGYVNDDDSDDDGLQDGREYELFGAGTDIPAADGNDGELNDDSICCICDPDSDGDGLSDGEEIHTGTLALDWDSDDDGLSDKEELQVYFTDPNNPDTDGDNATGVLGSRPSSITLNGYGGSYGDILLDSDGEEALSRTGVSPFTELGDQSDPLSKDTDGDGLQDDVEFQPGCNCGTGTDGYVNDDDSDDDGLQDGREYELFGVGADISSASGNDGELNDDSICCICDPDSDGDGLSDGEEVNTGTNPLDWDSDDDGLSDREELQTYNTDPNIDDTDGDRADGNVATRVAGTAPALSGYAGPDTIQCLSDCEEAFSGTSYPPFGDPFDETDPLQLDTDGDGLGDQIEFKVGCSCETTPDSQCPSTSYDDPNHYGVAYDPLKDGYANRSDSDEDGLRDGEDVHEDLKEADVAFPGMVFTILGEHCTVLQLREQQNDGIHSICDPDSDGDGLLDGEEFAIGTNWLDWDTDDDGRNDWHEHTGGGPIATDPFDPDTDDDGLLDSAEVFGSNTTNPVNADTDGDGLCDGGTGTPYMISGDSTVVVNPICKSCSTPGLSSCGTSVRTGSPDGIGDHPNPHGYGEDQNGNGSWDSGETDPNQYDTDGDAEGDGIEVLGFSTSRQYMIPATDLFGREIKVTYPATGCMDPLNPDTDGDGLSDGYEDRNHDGNFDFLKSEFDHADPLPGAPIPYPTETNPCDPDTDGDGLTDDRERDQPNPSAANPFNPTNPLDHDTDNDWLTDYEEVVYVCTEMTLTNLDNDGDGLIDEDPEDGIDNDLDGYIDEDGPDYRRRFVEVLDPTNRDSDSDGFIDGRDPHPCNSFVIPILKDYKGIPVDSDDDGFSDESELLSGTDPHDDMNYPEAFTTDLDGDQHEDDLIWLLGIKSRTVAGTAMIDIDSNVLIDARIKIISPRDVTKDDFDDDGIKDDHRYTIEYAFTNQRVIQPRLELVIYDLNSDLIINRIEQK